MINTSVQNVCTDNDIGTTTGLGLQTVSKEKFMSFLL